jgi:predicted amidohydrolase
MEAVVGDAPLRLGIYQAACHGADVGKRLDFLRRAAEQAGRKGAHLLLTRALYLSGYNVGDLIAARAEPQDGPSAQAVAEMAKEFSIAIAYGCPEKTKGADFNSCLALGPDGKVLANHRKLHLPSDYEKRYFQTADRVTTFDFRGWRFGIAVCYDVEFPETARACALKGASVLLAPTALAREWSLVARALIPTRAFENGLFVAYANYGGQEGDLEYLGESRIHGPMGEALALARGQEELILAELDPAAIAAARARLPYLVDRKIELPAG